jgi:4-hydroxy-tetrahydrodipicolinate synthase
MTKEKFSLHGSCVALPTPFRFGTVDFRALEELCHRQVDRGTAALVPCGTTGEAPLLTPDEHHRVIAATVAAAAGRVPVIAGAGNNKWAGWPGRSSSSSA